MTEHLIGKISDPADILRFMFAGNCTFTIYNPATEGRFTYRIQKHEKDDVWFAKVLTGPDNEHHFTYLGHFVIDRWFKERKTWFMDRKFRISATAPSRRAFDWFWSHLTQGQILVEFWHEGKCGRCNRKLTVPNSVELGIGPDCAEIMGINLRKAA